MTRRRRMLVGLLAIVVLLPAAHAAPPPPAAVEIEYLLSLVGSSGCEFNRNGSWYDAAQAEKHLRYKYEYLVAHDRVATAEEFIERAATKSSLSGQPYLLRCGDAKVVTFESWLRAALARYRLSGGH